MSHENYVIILDKERDFCRRFRSDSEAAPTGEILWAGDKLRQGYEAMIRLNKERRPVDTYSVCSKKSKKGRDIFKLFKGSPEVGYATLSIHVDYKPARAEIKKLIEARNTEEEAKRSFSFAVMDRVGIQSKRIPKWTAADLKYIEWLKEAGKIAA